MSEIDGYSAQQLQQLREHQQKVGEEQKSKSESEDTESEEDQESDEDDEDPVMMQDWTKRVEQEMRMKMCQPDLGLALNGAQD